MITTKKQVYFKNFGNFTEKHLCWRLFLNKVAGLYRSSCLQMFFKIVFLKNFANFTGKRLSSNFIKDTPTQLFCCEIWKNFKNTFSTEHLQWLFLSKETPTQEFACEIYEIFKNIFIQITSGGCF